MTSPKEKRTPPQRAFDDYVLYRVVSPEMNLCSIPDSVMQNVFITGNGGTSGVIDIGFDFVFDNITYKRFSFTNSGLVVLFDPLCTQPFVDDVLFPDENGVYTHIDMGRVRTDGFNAFVGGLINRQHVALVPWGGYQRSLYDNAIFSHTAAVTEGYNSGIIPKPVAYNETQHGCFIYRDDKSSFGRRLIIRFNITPAASSDSAHYRFECVLYENGTIEYRYAPRSHVRFTNSALSTTSSIGIFLSGTSTVRKFRDFAIGLGYREDIRSPYVNGGYVYDAAYFDNTGSQLTGGVTPYTAQLRADMHWPSPETGYGAAYVFKPPQNKKVTLPKIEQRKLDNRKVFPTQTRQGNINPVDRLPVSLFDDRRTQKFTSGAIVNAPVMNQRFYGQPEIDVVSRQGLFGGFEFTGTIGKDLSFLHENTNPTFTKPFDEFQRYEMELDGEFASGSSIDDFGLSLSQPTSAKTQVKFSLPVYRSTKMPPATSSIYYFNLTQKQWLVPQNTTRWDGSYSSSNFRRDWKSVFTSFGDSDFFNFSVLDDNRGFGPIGNYITSGSFNSILSRQNHTTAVTGIFVKSILQSTEYAGNVDEVFTLPINRPFLLERAVIEIPLKFGPGWFKDKTVSKSVIKGDGVTVSTVVDFAGPAMTFALVHQEAQGTAEVQRNIIMTGTLTHTFDNVKELLLSSTADYDIIYPSGFLSYDTSPAGIIDVESVNSFYTGSAVLRMIAGVSSGETIRVRKIFSSSMQEIVDQFSASHTSLVGQDATYYLKIGNVNPIGRGGQCLETNGRSSFGRDFFANLPDRVSNPFNPTFYDTVGFDVDALINDTLRSKTFACIIPNFQHKRSPYLIMPGDSLILCAAKMRPVMNQYSLSKVMSSSNLPGHDVQFNSGSINITLYGSTLRENVEYHDTLNQPLYSNAIHEVSIGNDPVIDQFDVEYRGSFIGSMSDDVITGSMVSIVSSNDGRTVLMTGSRARAVSSHRAHLEPRSLTVIGDRTSVQARPWINFAGLPRITQHVSDVEIYYDSLVPNFTKCVNLNGHRLITWETEGRLLPIVRLHGLGSLGLDNDVRWYRSFPFEPHYFGVERTFGMLNSIQTTSFMSSSNPFTTASADVGRSYSSIIVNTLQSNSTYLLFMDHINTGTGSFYGNDLLQQDDLSKLLYGFGDRYNLAAGGSGTNYMPGFTSIPVVSSSQTAPQIRGWRYGLSSGIVTKTKSYFRRSKYGQMRDMLEQRLNTCFIVNKKITKSPVVVKFVNSEGSLTTPENTWSSNLSVAATSSMPYYDGQSINRDDINTRKLNQGIISFTNDNGNITL